MKVLGVQLDEGNVPCNHESAWRVDEGNVPCNHESAWRTLWMRETYLAIMKVLGVWMREHVHRLNAPF